jgi:hypothetical protein
MSERNPMSTQTSSLEKTITGIVTATFSLN